ncbi:pirin family protein [Rhodoferax aquaticus]|uniref:Pirin family protein n=1 Tax=Rhodoferax aquaticus TaxID=2527691 RepID=A0A515ET09_9BURK|nr:pirin family protein [Rhodoferax aquaticus]QDL55812.1 pirin family protein [Rhodoferax aquaticus]
MSTSSILRLAPLGFPWQTLDPFLFCVHHHDAYPAGNAQLGPQASLAGRKLGQDFAGQDGWSMYHGDTVPGFPSHPHRGFETVTIARQGLIDHSDSLGATARFGGGDVQWLTAGQGIVHCEMFPLVHPHAPNPTELFQIWLNLPAKNKMAKPHFTMFWHEDIPRTVHVDAKDGHTEVVCIAGSLSGMQPLPPPPDSWASAPHSDLAIWTLTMSAGARWTLPAAQHPQTRRMLYFFKGPQLQVAGQAVNSHSAIELQADHAVELINGNAESECLVLQGRPIGEPVAQYGPFVMNTAAEIQQAFADYQRTEFGGWPWGASDPVHARDRGRFAQHADGTLEERSTESNPLAPTS